MKKRYQHRYIPIFILLVSFLLNFISWGSRQFCDFYALHVLPIWVNTLGRFSSLFSFSIGELMLLLGLLILIGAVIFCILSIFLWLFFRQTTFFQKIKKKGKLFFVAFTYLVSVVYLIMTLNCFILYHTSEFHSSYLFNKQATDKEQLSDSRDDMLRKERLSQNRSYTFDELVKVRNFVVEKANELSAQIKRDDTGTIIDTNSMEDTAIASMQNLGKEYGQLSGYYPLPKKLLFSGFISQQKMLGYYFPFSMEANYNSIMCIMNKPSTMCHELAHVRGYLREDEANFIGYLACVHSNDLMFQYSGYLSVLYYLDNDLYKNLGKNRELYSQYPSILPQVKEDNRFLTDETWNTVEEKSLLKTEVVSKYADEFIETNLVAHGIADGALSYHRVVELLLEYYDNGAIDD
ncbi:DUF3810 domain-containing protein [Lachnospiraceae bacterium ZAX-1]